MGINSNPNKSSKKAELIKANTSQKTQIIGFFAVITLLPLKMALPDHNQNRNVSINL